MSLKLGFRNLDYKQVLGIIKLTHGLITDAGMFIVQPCLDFGFWHKLTSNLPHW